MRLSEPTCFEDVTVPPPPPGPADWNHRGYVLIRNFFESDVIDRYREVWERQNGFVGVHDNGSIRAKRPGGWPDATPYMRHPEILDLLAPLSHYLEALIGEPAGVHLNLTGWISTEREWHQDSYLNPPHVGDSYAAVWCALGDIDENTGPFQYVPGSHRWRQVTRQTIGKYVDIQGRRWPRESQKILTPLFDQEIERRGAEVITHLPQKGDVFIWHGRLLHRGSMPATPHAYRPALIAHFSGIHHRKDMPGAIEYGRGGWYFPLSGRHKLE